MNLIFGYLAIGFVISSSMFVDHGSEAKVSIAGREASIAVEQVERHAPLPGAAASYRVFAKELEQQTTKPLDQWPMECEGAASRLDFAVINTGKLEGAYLILIARLGSGEVSPRLNQARLAGVKEYVLRRGSDLKYVLAEGSRVKGLGRIEVYVGGQLTEIMPLRRNAKGYCVPGRNGG